MQHHPLPEAHLPMTNSCPFLTSGMAMTIVQDYIACCMHLCPPSPLYTSVISLSRQTASPVAVIIWLNYQQQLSQWPHGHLSQLTVSIDWATCSLGIQIYNLSCHDTCLLHVASHTFSCVLICIGFLCVQYLVSISFDRDTYGLDKVSGEQFQNSQVLKLKASKGFLNLGCIQFKKEYNFYP